ncbi:hypothetical protein PG996_006927 [Apiospora saccharicola]|uniref:Uncharacterized protein n=1 Tax=Apiospora saccharicola TaxID=335842 RepID=A0ABR1V9D4_9PEZI
MCVIDSKPFHCEKCKQSGKIIINEISTCTSCPEKDNEYNQFECPELQENVLTPLTGDQQGSDASLEKTHEIFYTK